MIISVLLIQGVCLVKYGSTRIQSKPSAENWPFKARVALKSKPKIIEISGDITVNTFSTYSYIMSAGI